MALVRNFQALTSLPNQIGLNWNQPVGFNMVDSEVIVTRTSSHYPMELFNPDFPTKATDVRPVEIFRGKTIVGLETANISVLGNVLTDTGASFPTNPKLNGRLLRDCTGQTFTIESNTTTSVTLSGNPVSGIYAILAEFPNTIRVQQNFESDIRTTSGPVFISNLVQLLNGSLSITNFDNDELVNLIFKDGNGDKFVVKTNTATTVTFFERYRFKNTNLVAYTYDDVTGIVQYASAVDLSQVTPGNIFRDSSGDTFSITAVNDAGDNVTIAAGQTVDTTTPSSLDQGSIIMNDVPLIGTGMAFLNNFTNTQPSPYIDTFKTDVEASSRVGTGLLDNQFYYYTGFTKPTGKNVAQAEFASVDSGNSTQSAAISTKNRQFGDLLYNYWPSVARELDTTGDLQDLMNVFAFQFGELHAIIDTYRLQDTEVVFVNALAAGADQTGLPSVGFSIGADTLRRIVDDMLPAWKLKGSKEGIALFIRIITTWDVTNGTADFSSAIIDFLPNVTAFRFFDPNLGSTNVRFTQTNPFVAGGRFAKSLPGIVIPGFFTFREFVVTIPNVALYVGASTGFSVANGNTTMTDSLGNFGANNSLVGNFLLPNQDEVNDIFQIVSNTANSITVRGVINNRVAGGNYAVLSPLNTNRFVILNRLLPVYIPFGTKAGFKFT